MIKQCIICNIIAYIVAPFCLLFICTQPLHWIDNWTLSSVNCSSYFNIGHLPKWCKCFTADTAILNLLSELEEMEPKSNAFSERLRFWIDRRVKERRNEDVVWLAKFLVNPDTILKDDKISGRKPVKSTCINLTNKLAKRLISKDNEKEEDEEAKPVQKTTSAEVNERCFVGTAWARGPKITRS